MAVPGPIRSLCVLAALAFTGCQHVQTRVDGTGDALPTVLPVVAADDRVPDPAGQAGPGPYLPPMELGPTHRVERGLDLGECLAIAARNSATARALEARRAALACEREDRHRLPCHDTERADRLLDGALALQAAESRNDDAGRAGEVFLQLALATTQEALARQSLRELDAALGSARAQVRRGLPAGDAEYRLRAQELDVRAKRARLLEGIDRLSATLRQMLVLAPEGEDWLIHPQIDWPVIPDIPDEGSAIGIAMTHRPQLHLLRMVVHEMDQDTIGLAAQLLSTIQPLVGVGTPRISCIKRIVAAIAAEFHGTEPKSVTGARTLAREILTARERSVTAEVSDALLAVRHQVEQIAVARARYALRGEELARLRTRSVRGLATNLEVSAARLALLEAHNEWLEAVIQFKIREVRLAQAEGLLAP